MLIEIESKIAWRNTIDPFQIQDLTSMKLISNATVYEMLTKHSWLISVNWMGTRSKH